MTHPRMHNVRSARRRGISLVEVAAGLAIMGVVGVTTMHFVGEQSQAQRALTAAATLGTVRDAAQDFLRANYQSLLASNPVGGAPTLVPVARTTLGGTVPTGSLQDRGFLPSSMVDRNSYQQNHSVLVRQTSPGTLEALVVQTGGSAIRDSDLGRIVQRMGTNGGARFATVTSPSLATVVQGNGGAWAMDSATWTAGGVSPQTGRAAGLANFGSASMLSDYLNRYNVSIPEANTMRTALNMGTNNINAIGIVNAQSAQLQNGGNACASNAVGCTLWFGSQNGMVSYADGWLRLQGQTAGAGLSLEGVGNNLYVGGRADVVGAITTQDTVWAQNGARIGRDTLGNPTGAGFIDVSGNAFVSGVVSIGQDPITGLPTGLGQLSVQGPGTFTGNLGTYADSYTGANSYVGGNLGVNGTGNIGGNFGVGGNITTYGSIFANGTIATNQDVIANRDITAAGTMTANGNITGYSNVAAAMNVGAGVDVTAGRDVIALNRVVGTRGVTTNLNAVVATACVIEATIARNNTDGGLLWCQNGMWVSPNAPFSRIRANFQIAGSSGVMCNTDSTTWFVNASGLGSPSWSGKNYTRMNVWAMDGSIFIQNVSGSGAGGGGAWASGGSDGPVPPGYCFEVLAENVSPYAQVTIWN